MSRRIRQIVSSTLVVVVALFLVSCVSKPTMKLHRASVQSVSPAGIHLTLFMKVTNDNSFDVQVRNVRANVTLAGRYRMPPIRYNPAHWLPADGTTIVPVPVVIPWNLIGPLLQTTVGYTTIPYRTTGYVDVTATSSLQVENNDYELDEKGQISRAELVAAGGRTLGIMR